MTSAEARVIGVTLDHIQTDLARLGTTLQDITSSLKQIPEIHQAQQYIRMELASGAKVTQDHETRIQVIERDLPGLRELRKWVIAGVMAGVGMLGAALVKLVVMDVPRIPTVVYQKDPQDETETRTFPQGK